MLEVRNIPWLSKSYLYAKGKISIFLLKREMLLLQDGFVFNNGDKCLPQKLNV